MKSWKTAVKAGRQSIWLLLVIASTILAPTLGCKPQASEPTGGETHFLRYCSPESNLCGDGLSCLCGVCTRTCDISNCEDLPAAVCLPQTSKSCGDATTKSTCDATCVDDDDCLRVSLRHSCENGVCRQGNDGEGGGTSEVEIGLICTTDAVRPSDVLFIGDSFFAVSPRIATLTESHARQARVLGPEEHFRDSSSLENNSLAISGPGILNQYMSARESSPPKLLIVAAGGADVFLGVCETANASCPVIDGAARAFGELLTAAHEGGVEQILYVTYPEPQLDDVRTRLDALRPLLDESCENSSIPCHRLDLRPVFVDKYSEYILEDGLNPSAEGAVAAADAIWKAILEPCRLQ